MVEVRLLGNVEVLVDGARIEACASRRAWSLLAWLALYPGEHRRTGVAARFWPDVLDSSARGSLRSAIWTLRRTLGPEAEEALVADRDRVALVARTDLAEFEERVAAGDLEGAVALHRGPLLADLDDDWLLEARDGHAERVGDLRPGCARGAGACDEDILTGVQPAELAGHIDQLGEGLVESSTHVINDG